MGARMYLKLNFESLPHTAQLVRFEFNHPLVGRSLVSYRGKSPKTDSSEGSFLWTSAVRAVAVLICRASYTQGEEPLSGFQHSLAASLDYALDKCPTWLVEMFGADSEGRLVAKRLLKRSNSYCRGAGPIRIWLNRDFFPISEIQISLDGRTLTDKSELQKLVAVMERDKSHRWPGPRSSMEVNTSQNPTFGPKIRQGLLDEFKRELSYGLFNTLAFRSKAKTDALRRLYNTPLFRRLAGDSSSTLTNVCCNESVFERVGFQSTGQAPCRAFFHAEPFTFTVGPGGITSLAIFQYLKNNQGFNVGVNSGYLNSQDIINAIVDGDGENVVGDAIVLAVSCAARLLGMQTDYQPLMVMPATSHKRLSRISTKRVSNHSIETLLLTHSVSSAAFYHELGQHKGVSTSSKRTHLEPDEIAAYVQESQGNINIISWWPFYHFQRALAPTLKVESLDRWEYDTTLLFVHRRWLQDTTSAQAIRSAIANAWLKVREDECYQQAFASELVSSDDYVNLLTRTNGVHNLIRTAGK